MLEVPDACEDHGGVVGVHGGGHIGVLGAPARLDDGRYPCVQGLLRAVRYGVDVLLLSVVVVWLGGVTVGRILPALGHPVYVVAGPSMEPAIPVGAAVVLASVPSESLRGGDVVSLRSGPSRAVFTHRIVRIVPREDGNWIETRGDANAQPDPALSPTSDVIGRVGMVLPLAGYGLTVLSAPTGVVFVLSTGALLITLGWCLDGVRPERRRRAAAAVAAVPAGAVPAGAVPMSAPPARVPPTGPQRRPSTRPRIAARRA